MLPKLQHIRVVAKEFKDFDIPAEFKALWRYMQNAYESEVFRQTCPSDSEILYHWLNKPELPKQAKDWEKKYLCMPEGTYSFDVPK